MNLNSSDLSHRGELPFVITLSNGASTEMEIKVSNSTLVPDVQRTFAKEAGTQMSDLRFEHDNRRMGTLGYTIFEDKISDGDYIKVKEIFLRIVFSSDDKTYRCSVKPSTQISEVREEVAKAFGVPTCQLRILHEDLVVRDGSISDYDIEDGDCLEVYLEHSGC